ncbi:MULTISPECIES: hypothetical protein [Arthrobacter]|uniref:hypothetical protein n=1 Tax=Arthrobacter TaxID=1663 RepID=UPI0012B59BBE|nr:MULTISPECIES: hypothetical protein [Arthrobacter]
MSLKTRSFRAIASIAALGFLGFSIAGAAAPPQEAPSPVLVEQTNSLAGELLVENGTVTLDYAKAEARISDPGILTEFLSGFVGAGGIVTNAPEGTLPATLSTEESSAVQALASCAGRTRAWKDVWGTHIEINSCSGANLAVQMGLGAAGIGAVTAILAVIPGIDLATTPIGTIAAAVMGFGAAAVIACNQHDGQPTGLTLHITGVPWCGYQT